MADEQSAQQGSGSAQQAQASQSRPTSASQQVSAPGQQSSQESSSSESSGGSFIQKEAEARRAREDAEQRRQDELVEEQARLSFEAREAWENSDLSTVHKQVQEAEAIMRGPSPARYTVDHEGNRVEPGQVPGDPTKGPSH